METLKGCSNSITRKNKWNRTKRNLHHGSHHYSTQNNTQHKHYKT